MDEKQNAAKTNQTDKQSQLPAQEPNLDSKFSIKGILRQGENQYNPMPTEQKFTPPPQVASVPNTPLPTQPIPDNIGKMKTPKTHFEVKIILLITALLLAAIIIVAASLHYTQYFIYEPPAQVKNTIDSIFSKIPNFNLNLPLPKLPFFKN